jgi:transmembrane sensor
MSGSGSHASDFSRTQKLNAEAAAWLARVNAGNWTDDDQVQLDTWLAEARGNRVAYWRLEAAWSESARLAALRPFRREPANVWRIPLRWLAVPVLAAASIALLVEFGIPFVASLLAPPDRVDSTDVGGRTLLSFADHTQIELNTDTTVRTRMTTAERTVWLEKGEAWFHVTHDAAHPFTVIVGKHRITDLGTEFLVRRSADAVDVTVVNGRASLSADGAQTATLNPGEEAVATPTTLSVTRKTLQELADELAWRRGVLVFRDTRLSDAVREVNRYNTIKLVIADPSIEDLKFTGEIKNDNVEDFLQAAQSLMNLHADRHGKDILLSRDARANAKGHTHKT